MMVFCLYFSVFILGYNYLRSQSFNFLLNSLQTYFIIQNKCRGLEALHYVLKITELDYYHAAEILF